MNIVYAISTLFFWIGYPLVLFFKISYQMIGKILYQVRKFTWILLLLLRKVFRLSRFSNGFKKVNHYKFLRIFKKISFSETKKSKKTIEKKQNNDESYLFSYDWYDANSKFDLNNSWFEVLWLWKRGLWRKRFLLKSTLPHFGWNIETRQFSYSLKIIKIPVWVQVWLGILLFSSGVGYFSYQIILTDLPNPQDIGTRTPKMTTKIYDRDGNLLYKIFKDENRTYVPLSEISPSMVQATLAIEDSQFYEHWGISFRGIGRAFWHNVQNDSVQGGSTITQQLVKNTLLSPERTWQRKIREIVLALAVDALYSKEQILEMYLNEVNYGGSTYGVEEAGQWYFGKAAKDLTLAESALLSGLPAAPTTYNPFGSQPDRAQNRQKEVLKRMQEIGFITSEQYEQASYEQVVYRNGQFDIRSPHFVMYIRELLVDQYGEEMVSHGGLEVYTTLDPVLQASAESAVQSEVSKLAHMKVSNGATLVTNPHSGEILAMVGSVNYFDREQDGQVNVVFRERQPGSSIKPVTYALAFEQGYTPQSMIDDVPVSYSAPGTPTYAPKNYDGQFYGRITLREALATSRNIPAVRLLAELGVNKFAAFGQKLGITTWDDSTRHGLSMTLGSNEVTMFDMAKVYGIFANGGETVALNPLLLVYDHSGKVLYQNHCAQSSVNCEKTSVISPVTAFQITSVLSDNQSRSRAFGLNSVLHIPGQEVAVKTGTTNSLRDNWTIGYTSDAVVVSWVGNNDNSPMSSVASGITGASPIWNEIMKQSIQESHATIAHTFSLPNGYQRVQICAATGTLPCRGCPRVIEAVLPLNQIPQRSCSPDWFAEGVLTDEKKTAQAR